MLHGTYYHIQQTQLGISRSSPDSLWLINEITTNFVFELKLSPAYLRTTKCCLSSCDCCQNLFRLSLECMPFTYLRQPFTPYGPFISDSFQSLVNLNEKKIHNCLQHCFINDKNDRNSKISCISILFFQVLKLLLFSRSKIPFKSDFHFLLNEWSFLLPASILLQFLRLHNDLSLSFVHRD